MQLDVKLFGYYPGAHCTTCSNFSGCGGKGHHEWDFESIKEKLLARYGDRIRVSLINVFSDEMKAFPEIQAHVKKYGLRIPVLALEGEIIAWGGDATDDMVIKAIDCALDEMAREQAAAQ
jgi:hypothetical protein